MQKLINVLALSSFVVSAAVVGGGTWLYLNKDVMVEEAREKITAAATEAIAGALPGMLDAAMPELPQATGDAIPSTTGSVIPSL
jgi:hypothetical protein|tara:strand:+ start:353 stop:604 length:252 start_codon:yes stop_codon:yes gene_type:complete